MFRPYNDFVNDPLGVVQECHRFLGLDPSLVPTSTPDSHYSGKPKSQRLSSWISRPSPTRRAIKHVIPSSLAEQMRSAVIRRTVERVKLDGEIRSELTENFRQDIERLGALIGRDMSSWIDGKSPERSNPDSPK